MNNTPVNTGSTSVHIVAIAPAKQPIATRVLDAQVGRVTRNRPARIRLPPPHNERNQNATAPASIGSDERTRTATSTTPSTMNVSATNQASHVDTRRLRTDGPYLLAKPSPITMSPGT